MLKKCVVCGNEFESKKNRKTCFSESCKMALRKQTKRERYLRNKAHFVEYAKIWHQNHREIGKEQVKRWRKEKQVQIKLLLGDHCLICKTTSKIQYHEKSGLNHTDFGNLGSNPNYILKHAKDFVPLCFWCHRSVHFLSKSSEIDANLLLSLIQELNKKKGENSSV